MKDHRIKDSCPVAWDWIERDLDGTLEPAQRQRLREHLHGCAECAALHDDAIVVRGLVRSVPRPVCPPRAVDAVLARIDGEQAAATRARRWLPWGNHSDPARAPRGGTRRPTPAAAWTRVGMAVAAAAVLLLVVPTLVRRGEPTPQQTAVHAVPPTGAAAASQGQSLTAEQRAQAQQAMEQARLALGVLARALDRTSELAEQNMRASIAAPMRRALEPRRRSERQSEEESQEPDRRTGVLPGAAWSTGKC